MVTKEAAPHSPIPSLVVNKEAATYSPIPIQVETKEAAPNSPIPLLAGTKENVFLSPYPLSSFVTYSRSLLLEKLQISLVRFWKKQLKILINLFSMFS